MRCREFRSKHVGFVDDTLSAVEMEAMQRHLAVCASCSRHNTAIRRSLLLFRNLPSIEPSPDFSSRLNRRLDEIGPPSPIQLTSTDVTSMRLTSMPPRYPSFVAVAGMVAGLAAVALLAFQISRDRAVQRMPLPGRAVATAPLPPGAVIPPSVTPAIVNPAMVASVPTGIPVWPAMLMVSQASTRLASLDFHDGELRR